MSIWFQRSGSLIVLFASISEYHAFKILSTYSPPELTNTPEITRKILHCNQARMIMIASACLIGVGTIIWGYGDLLYEVVQ